MVSLFEAFINNNGTEASYTIVRPSAVVVATVVRTRWNAGTLYTCVCLHVYIYAPWSQLAYAGDIVFPQAV